MVNSGSGSLGFGDHLGRAFGVAEGQQVCVLSEHACSSVVERDALAVDDGVPGRLAVVGVLDHGFRIGRPGRSSRGPGVSNEFSDVFGERAVGIVVAYERDAEQLVVQTQVVELNWRQVKREECRVQRDVCPPQVAVDPGMGAQHLGVQSRGGVDGLEVVGIRGLADLGRLRPSDSSWESSHFSPDYPLKR